MVALCTKLDGQLQCELLVELRVDYLSILFQKDKCWTLLIPYSPIGKTPSQVFSEPNGAGMESLGAFLGLESKV